jgi:SAM-dependent methyltransferase
MSSQTEKDIDTITELIDVKNKSVLELGCGPGRITFALADKVQEIVAIDIDVKSIEAARKTNLHSNVTFLVENMENFDLKRKFDVILSVGVGYMYLKDLPSAIRNISHHLNTNGVVLLLCGSPNNEYQRIVDLLVEENVRSVSFYNKFEKILSNHFTCDKKHIKEPLDFSDFGEVLRSFQTHLKGEYATEMNDHHEEVLRGYFQRKGRLSVEDESQTYICRHL